MEANSGPIRLSTREKFRSFFTGVSRTFGITGSPMRSDTAPLSTRDPHEIRAEYKEAQRQMHEIEQVEVLGIEPIESEE